MDAKIQLLFLQPPETSYNLGLDFETNRSIFLTQKMQFHHSSALFEWKENGTKE